MLTVNQQKFFEKAVTEKEEIKFDGSKYYIEHLDSNDNCTYYENSNGFWIKKKYNKKGFCTYFEDSYGYWEKQKYNKKGFCTYFENSDGCWSKRKFDSKGNCIKTITSDD